MIKLRPHQEKAVEQIRESLRKGHKRPLLAAPCSMGKTIIAGFIMQQASAKLKKSGEPYRVVFFCDRIKLVHQTTQALDKIGLEYSVLQADDPRYDPRCPVQIASVQTAVRRTHFHFDLAIVDECHMMYKGLVEGFMERYDQVPFIGLSATPYSKGLGKYYDDLLVTITPRELIDMGYLCPTDYYVYQSVDTSQVKSRPLRTGGSDYDPIALGEAMMDSETFNGDVVKNYLKHSNGLTRRAIAFSPSVAHSKSLVERFNLAGIPALHIDGYMPEEERKYIYEEHRSGDALVLSCSQLLGTGYDDPGVEILIDAYPTKKTSKINWIQRAGRIWRTAPGKERATYLDHAGNLQTHNIFPEDVIPERLDDGTKTFDERDQIKSEEKEKILRQCPVCSAGFSGRVCACGYEIPKREPEFIDNGAMLQKVENLPTKQDRQDFYSQLLGHAYSKGYSPGWAAHSYRMKFKEYPKGLEMKPQNVGPEVKKFIQYTNIRRAKSARR